MSKNPLIDSMVDDFLKWPLPASVCSDRIATMPGEKHRIGTHLLTAAEAKAMFEAVVMPKILALHARHAVAVETINQTESLAAHLHALLGNVKAAVK